MRVIDGFDQTDLEWMNVNKFTEMSLMEGILQSPSLCSHTIVDSAGDPFIIFFAIEYSPTKFSGFLIASNDFSGVDKMRFVKKFVKNSFLSYNMTRLETLSFDCDELNRWHKFLGFELEGTKKKFIGNKNYNVWGMI